MTTIYPTTPTGFVVFCDDIRTEITGKSVLVGVYNGFMYYTAPFPIFLPKLAIRITYIESPGESTELVQIRVLMIEGSEQKVIHTYDLPAADREKVITPKIPTDARVFLTSVQNVELGPTIIQKECRISVRAYRGDLEIRLGSLNIRQHPQLTPPAPPDSEKSD